MDRHRLRVITQVITIKDTTRGPVTWQIKAVCGHLVDHDDQGLAMSTDRAYWLIVARNPQTGETKYFVSNALANVDLTQMLQAAFAPFEPSKKNRCLAVAAGQRWIQCPGFS